jgi:hypothetical protein
MSVEWPCESRFMSLIDTWQLCGANSFNYLTEWQRVGSLRLFPTNVITATPRHWRRVPLRGCRGTIAGPWSGSCPSQIPRRVMRNSAVPPGRKQESSAILERQLKMTGKRSSKEAKPQAVLGRHATFEMLWAGFYARVPTLDQQTFPWGV